MTFKMKPLSCDPARIKGMSERLIVSHYENNYGGAVKRLNVIEEKLAELDYDKAAGFLINGLKREQLIAMNSMILHEAAQVYRIARWCGSVAACGARAASKTFAEDRVSFGPIRATSSVQRARLPR